MLAVITNFFSLPHSFRLCLADACTREVHQQFREGLKGNGQRVRFPSFCKENEEHVECAAQRIDDHRWLMLVRYDSFIWDKRVERHF